MKSVIEYFTQYKSNVFVATLDLTKAFDRVSHYDLLIKLYKSNILVVIKLYKSNILVDLIVMFKFWFHRTFDIIYWKGCVSQILYIRNGVKQGGICLY